MPRSLDLLIPLFLTLTSAVYFLSDNEADNDLWIHLLTGREIIAARALPVSDTWSFTSGGAQWVDHEWLAQVLFAASFSVLHDTGIWLLKLVIAFATAFLLWRMVARRTNAVWIQAAVMTLAVAVMGRGFAMRPQIFTYLATAILLDWIGRKAVLTHGQALRSNALHLLVIAIFFVFWANAHGGFVFGLGVLGLWMALPPWNGWLRRAVVFVAACVAVCINPYGASLLTYIAHELQTAHPITEWQAAAPSDPALFSYFVLAAAFVLTAPFSKAVRQQPWMFAVAAATLVMSLRHQRHAPLLALCAAPLIAEQLDGTLAWLRQKTTFTLSTGALRIIGLAVAVIAVLQLGLIGRRLAQDGAHVMYEATDYPVHAIRFLRAKKMTGNIALPLDWGGYVLWHGRFDLRVSLDGRFATVYPPAAVTANFAFFGDGSARDAARMIDEYGATIVLAPTGWHTAAHDRPEWTLRYRDDVAEVLALGPTTRPVTNQPALGRIPFP